MVLWTDGDALDPTGGVAADYVPVTQTERPARQPGKVQQRITTDRLDWNPHHHGNVNVIA